MRGFATRPLVVTTGEKTVAVEWPDRQKSNFHYSWLLHNCSCAVCQDQSSGQKTLTPHIASSHPPAPPARIIADEAAEELTVQWQHSHTSTYSFDWLRKNCYTINSSPEALEKRLPKTWTAKEMPVVPAFSYKSVVQDETGIEGWLDAIHDYGVALVTEVPCNTGEIVTVAEKLGPLMPTIYGATFDVRSEQQAVNIAYTATELDFHMDLCYYEEPPGIQLLHCLEQANVGGESVLADSFAAAFALRDSHPEHFETLTQIPLTFHKHHDTAMMKYRRPMFVTDPLTKELVSIFYSPQFEGPLYASVDDCDRFYTAYGAYVKELKQEKYLNQFKMNAGDLLVFNNRRVLHGRKSFDPSSGNRHLRGTYVSMNDFANRLRTFKRDIKKDRDFVMRNLGNGSM